MAKGTYGFRVETPFTQACMQNDLPKARWFLKNGLGLNINSEDSLGNTVLHYTILAGGIEMAKLLIERGADVNHTDKHNDSLLSLAAFWNKTEIAKLLVKNGAKVNHANREQTTPLFFAVERRNAEMVEVLIENGANVNHINKDKNTPLTSAFRMRNKKVIEMLIAYGADITHTNQNGDSCLTLAVGCDARGIVQFLLDCGLDVNHANRDMRTPLMVASENDFDDILGLLIFFGARIDCRDREGRTALMLACRNSSDVSFKLLLNEGADVSVRDSTGHTMLSTCLKHISNESRCFPFVDSLVAKTAFLEGDYHLLILFSNKVAKICHRKSAVMPSFESFTKDVLPVELSFLEGQGLTPFSCSLLADNQDLARFFVSNWFLHANDLALNCSDLHNCLNLNEDSRQFLRDVFSQPWTLRSLSFIQVSTCLGFGPSREERVKNAGLPPLLQRWLRFETPEWNIESPLWSELTFQFIHLNRRNRR